jgi:peptidyl-prolyl cis-trans isomerase C
MEWRASHILVKERGLAQELLKKIRSGARFDALARDYSSCPSKSKGGDLGWFGPGKMAKPFEDAVARLRRGSVSGVVRTQFGFHIIKKTGER